MDRTEPPIGSKTLLELFKKYGDKWMVSLLFDDLLDWSNWFMRRRLLPPLDMVALGSFNEEADITSRFSAENMQGARFESGLDNSPMCKFQPSNCNHRHCNRENANDAHSPCCMWMQMMASFMTAPTPS